MIGLACLYIIKLVMHLATKSICPKKYAGTIWIVYKIFFEGILKMQMDLWFVRGVWVDNKQGSNFIAATEWNMQLCTPSPMSNLDPIQI